MRRRRLGWLGGVVSGAVMLAGVAWAHITPPVVLMSDRDAIVTLLAGAQRFFVREVRLSRSEQAQIKQQTGWTPDEDFYRFYLGRDGQGRLVAGTIFVTEFTVHGPIRIAVSLGPDGKVRGAAVVELTEETYRWVKPLIDRDFARDYAGQDSRGHFHLSARLGNLEAMPQFYGQVIASLIQRAALRYDVGVLKRRDASEPARIARALHSAQEETRDGHASRGRRPRAAHARRARGRGLERRHPVADDLHAGLGAARRAGSALRAPDGLHAEDGLGRHGSGARARRARGSGRRALPRAVTGEALPRRWHADESPARHVQRLRARRPRGGSGEDRRRQERGRRARQDRRRGRPLRVAR